MLLGTAAGGGFPQWNCWCPTCRVARETPVRAKPRTQSSIAISADGHRWFLCNASPDVHAQLARIACDPAPATRATPIEGIVLTDAEIDHTLGIAMLRESGRLRVHCTAAVRHTLEREFPLLVVTRAFAEVEIIELPLYAPIGLANGDGTPSGLTVEAFPIPGDPPRFASPGMRGHTVGLVIRDDKGAGCACMPACAALDENLLARLGTFPLVLIDGTFWRDDELRDLGFSDRRARQMGHIPVGDDDGSLRLLSGLAPATTVVYTHINNSNAMLVEHSSERAAVTRAGCVVGEDGMHFSIIARPPSVVRLA